MKICPVGAKLFHVNGWMDRQTDRHDKANSRFSQFCERAWKLVAVTSKRIWYL